VAGIIDRYVVREVARTFVGVTVVLMLILVGNQFVRVLTRAASDRLVKEAVFELLAITSMEYLSMLLPVAMFIAIILALGRMHQDSEMAALGACGIGPMRLYRPLLAIAGLLAAVSAWLAFDYSPRLRLEAHYIKVEAKRQLQSAMLVAGRFRSMPDGGLVFYARDMDADGVLQDVFIQRRDGERLEVVVAASGLQRDSEDGNQREIVLRQGRRFFGTPGTLDFTLVDFEEHGIPIVFPPLDTTPDDTDMMPIADLIGTGDPEDLAELHWRLSVPLSLVMLALIAVPLSRTHHRDSRFARLGVALLVYLFYSNLLGVARMLVSNDSVPRWFGMWWVHIIMVVVTFLMLGSQYRWRLRRVAARPA